MTGRIQANAPAEVLVRMAVRKHMRELERDIAHAVYGESWRRYVSPGFFDPALTDFECEVRDTILKRLNHATPPQD